jgi:hypothetical protein
MLTTSQMQAVLDRVTYKNGWAFHIYAGRHEGTHCTITTSVPDAYNPDTMTTLSIETFLSPNDTRDEASLVEWLLYRCARIEVHECREFLRLDGKPWSDPHGQDADQDL